MKRFLTWIIAGVLFLSACGTTTDTGLPFVKENPETMQFLVRQYHASKNFTDFKDVKKEYELEEGQPDEYYREQEQRVTYGYTAITELQNLLKKAEVTETEEAPYDMDLFYMTKLADGTLYYFYSTGDLKVISGDNKTFYKVNSEDYLNYVSDLSERLKEVQWY